MAAERGRWRLRFTVGTMMLVVLGLALCLFPLNLLALKQTYSRRSLFHAKESVRLQRRAQWESLGETPEWRDQLQENIVYHSALAHKYRNAVSAPWKGVAPDPTPPHEPPSRPSQALTIPIRPIPIPNEGAYFILDSSGLAIPILRPGLRGSFEK